MNNKDEINKRIESLVTGIGVTGEFLGLLRKSLETNGFTREEAVGMCTKILLETLINNRGDIE